MVDEGLIAKIIEDEGFLVPLVEVKKAKKWIKFIDTIKMVKDSSQ